VKQTLVSAFADVAEKLPVGSVHENESAFGVGDVNVVGSVHRNPIWQQQAAPRSPFDAERVAAPEDVNGTDVRVNNEDASAGVNRNVMGRQKNSFASVGKGDNVIPKQRQQRLPFYRFHSMGRRFIVLFDTLPGMKIDEIGNLAGPRPGEARVRIPAADVGTIDSRRRSKFSVRAILPEIVNCAPTAQPRPRERS
jgi:hypothetical protein